MSMMLRMAGTLGQRLGVDPALVGWWKFDGDLADASGNGNHGTVGAGSEAYAAGVYGQAWDNDATRYVDCGNDASLKITGALTLSLWVYFDSVPTDNLGLFGKYLATTGGRSYGFWLSDGLFVFGLSSSGTSAVTIPTEDRPALKIGWTHYAGTFTPNGEMILYVDGIQYASRPAVAEIFDSNTTVKIGDGTFTSGTTRPTCRIDNAMIFPRALSASEIKTLYALGSPL